MGQDGVGTCARGVHDARDGDKRRQQHMRSSQIYRDPYLHPCLVVSKIDFLIQC